MKSAIGNSLLLYIVIIIVSAIIILFISILSYSKAYRVKNGIIEIIERNNGHDTKDNDGNNVVEKEIANFLRQSGYKVGTNNKCKSILEKKGISQIITTTNNYNYCLGRTETENGSYYYTVISFVEFDFPIIDSIMSIPISGETKILNRTYDNYN